MRFATIHRLAGTLAGAVVLCGSCIDNGSQMPATGPDGDPEPFTHVLTIARHIDQPITAEGIDTIFAEAGGLLYSIERECPDTYCPVTFARDGSVAVFSQGGAVVTSDAQLDEVFNVNADFKVVSFMVGVCGAPGGSDPAVVLGCAATATSVVIAFDAPSDVWAHEWGHVQGLPHRNDCPRNLMHAYELETNAVNEHERDALLTPTPTSAFIRLRVSGEDACDDCVMDDRDAPLSVRVERLVSRTYLQGIPADTLGDVAPAARADELVACWSRGLPAHACANAARLMGLTGDARCSPFLLDALNRLDGALSTDDLAMAAESMLALGRLAATDDTGGALQFLVDGASADYWAERGLTLGDPGAPGAPLDDAFARLCVMGLGVSGTAEARTVLTELQSAASTRKARDPWYAAQVEDALARLDGSAARLRPVGAPDRQP